MPSSSSCSAGRSTPVRSSSTPLSATGWVTPMSELLPFVVVGLTTGAIYGFAGVGLVLTYRTSGVFNFAHGGVATVAAYSFYELHYRHGLPWPIALAVCVGGVGLAGG